MTNERHTSHLPPEVFVDVLEGSPVDASWRQHLETCKACGEEVEELKRTLALLDADAAIAAPTLAPAPRRWASSWVAAAAAVLAAVSIGYWGFIEKERVAPAALDAEELLPPVDDDDAFQLLLALSGAVDEDITESMAMDEVGLDPGRLTPEEQQRFVERLEEEMRSSL